MSSKRGFKIIIGTVLLVGGIVVLISLVLARELQRKKFTNPPQRQADGTVWTLVQLDYGRTNLPLDDNFLERLRRRYMPPAGLTAFGRQIIAPLPLATNNTTARRDRELVFSIRHNGITNGSGVNSQGFQFRTDLMINYRAIAFNELGQEYDVRPGTLQIQIPPNISPNPVSTWQLGAFPRDGEMVGLRIYRRNTSREWQKVAEFATRNPDPGSHAEWPKAAATATTALGRLEFSIKDLISRQRVPGSTNFNLGYNSRVEFRVTDDGKETDEWRAWSIVVTEANGNRSETLLSEATTNEGEQKYRFNTELDPAKTWKVRVEFARRKNIATSNLWQLAGVPVSSSPVTYSTNLNGMNLRAFVASTTVFGHVSPPTNGQRITLLGLVDDQGRKLITNAPVSSANAFAFSPKIPPDAKTLDVTFAVQQGVFVEFMIQPQIDTTPLPLMPAAFPSPRVRAIGPSTSPGYSPSLPMAPPPIPVRPSRANPGTNNPSLPQRAIREKPSP